MRECGGVTSRVPVGLHVVVGATRSRLSHCRSGAFRLQSNLLAIICRRYVLFSFLWENFLPPFFLPKKKAGFCLGLVAQQRIRTRLAIVFAACNNVPRQPTSCYVTLADCLINNSYKNLTNSNFIYTNEHWCFTVIHDRRLTAWFPFQKNNSFHIPSSPFFSFFLSLLIFFEPVKQPLNY